MFLLLVLALSACVAGQVKPTAGAGEPEGPEDRDLLSTEWRLEDLGGMGVLDRVEATISFPEAGKVAGNGSCNRFLGSAEIGGGRVRFRQIASTRRACVPAVMDQETKYLKALQDAARIIWDGPHLLIYSTGLEKPLRFSRIPTGMR